MRGRRLAVLVLALAAGVACAQAPQGGAGRGQGGGWGGPGGPMSRGTVGTVTAVAPDRFTVRTELGETYTIFYSVNTRFMKQPPGPPQRRGQGEGRGQGRGEGGYGGNMTPPETIKAAEIKVGDAIVAGGEVDANAKTVGAVMVMLIDPERAKEMRAMEASYGKTWLAGRVTAIAETKVTLERGPDKVTHSFVADENTTFRKRREPITLGDVQVGDMVRVEGAVKDGVFVATSVAVMGQPRDRGQGGPEQGPQ